MKRGEKKVTYNQDNRNRWSNNQAYQTKTSEGAQFQPANLLIDVEDLQEGKKYYQKIEKCQEIYKKGQKKQVRKTENVIREIKKEKNETFRTCVFHTVLEF